MVISMVSRAEREKQIVELLRQEPLTLRQIARKLQLSEEWTERLLSRMVRNYQLATFIKKRMKYYTLFRR